MRYLRAIVGYLFRHGFTRGTDLIIELNSFGSTIPYLAYNVDIFQY